MNAFLDTNCQCDAFQPSCIRHKSIYFPEFSFVPDTKNTSKIGLKARGGGTTVSDTKVCTSLVFCQRYQAIVNMLSGTSWDLQILNCLKEFATLAMQVRSWTNY